MYLVIQWLTYNAIKEQQHWVNFLRGIRTHVMICIGMGLYH